MDDLIQDDPQLEAIRQQRMAQLGAAGHGGGEMTPEAQQAQQEQAKAMEDQRTSMLQSILAPAARERLMRIALVKPEKARQVEEMMLQMAKRGQIGDRVSEDQLIKWLEQINTGGTTVASTISRPRRNIMDDDDW